MVTISRLIAFLWEHLAHRCFGKQRTAKAGALVLHQMLLGDGILLMPILQYLSSVGSVTVACPSSVIGLYKTFYPNVRYIEFSERRPLSVIAILLAGPFGEVVCPFERRMLRYARACQPKLIRTFVDARGGAGGASLITGKVPSAYPTTVSDMLSSLFPDQRPAIFQPLPQLVEQLSKRACLLHVDAKNPNRRWTPEHWRGLASLLRRSHFSIVWCLGPSPSSNSIAINLETDEIFTPRNLVEYLDRIRRCALIVCPDTGVAHLAKLAMTPTVIIYGQGNPALHGNGHYWSRGKTVNLFIDNMHCRDKNTAMGMKLDWLRRCDRLPKDCENPLCQNDIQPEEVYETIRNNYPELFEQINS